MRNDEIEKALIDGLEDAVKSFQKDELAYLALTSKIELAFRDRWAFALHQQAKENTISREWKRTDLTLLNGLNPIALVELKAMYTFDALKSDKLSYYMALLNKDEAKANCLLTKNNNTASVYTFLLATHPHTEIGPSFDQYVIKYKSPINKALREHGSKTLENANRNTVAALKANDWDVVAYDEVFAGTAFGTDTSVLYWLLHRK